MTRARDELVLTHAADYGGQRARRVSPFVLEALDLPVAAGAPGAGARPTTPLERLAALERTEAVPPAPRRRGDEPLVLSFYAIDDYLTCPLKYKYAHLLRVPLAPHHSLIYGSALHAAVAEFHRRHARGDVMTEDQLFASFEQAWTNDGFLSREHEEARLAAGRDALRRFRDEQLTPGAVTPAYVEREFSFLLDGDRVRGRMDRVDIVPRDPTDPVPVMADPSSGRGRRRADARAVPRAGRDHRLQVVRRARPGEGAPARQGLAPALDLRDGLRGDDRPAARRGRAQLPRDRARRHGSGGPAADRQGARGHPHGRAPGSGRATSRRSPTTCRAPGARSGRSARPARCAERGGARGRRPAGDRGRRWRARRRARWSRPTTSRRLRALPDACVDLVYADPPFAHRQTRAARLDPDRQPARRRVAGSASARTATRSCPSSRAGRLPLDEYLEALHAQLVEAHRVLRDDGSLYLHVDWRTAHHARLLLDEVFGPERFLNEIVWAYDYGGRARDRWPRKHDTILWYAKGDALDVRPRRDRPDPVPRAGARGPREGGPRQAADRRLVDDDRPDQLGRADRATRPRSPCACSSASSRRRAGRATSCWTRTPAAAPPASRPRASGDGGCSWTGTRRRSRSHGPGCRPRVAGDGGSGAEPGDHGHHPGLRQHAGPGAGVRPARGRPADRRGDGRRGSGRSTSRRCGGVWAEERERQFREEVPLFRETDLGQRIARVLARLRGMTPPPSDDRWDDEAAAAYTSPDEVAWTMEVYSAAFVDAPAAAARPGRAPRPARRPLSRRHPVQLAARRDHRPLRRGRRLDAVARRDRGLAAGRHDQAASGDLRGGAVGARRSRAVGDPPRRRRLGGGRRRCAAGRLARRLSPRPAERLAAAGQRARRRATRRSPRDLELATLDDLEAGLDRLRR